MTILAVLETHKGAMYLVTAVAGEVGARFDSLRGEFVYQRDGEERALRVDRDRRGWRVSLRRGTE